VDLSLPPPANHDRIPVLDGVRGLAILLVMFCHETVMVTENRLDMLWLHTAWFGWCGVDLFFVLSGFLITGILLDSKSDNHYFRNFYARRILRIFPLYYGVVFFSLIILPHIPNPKAHRFGQIAGDEIWYWMHLSNYITAWRQQMRHGILDVAWSLSIEEQFYLVWPAMVLLFNKRNLTKACIIIISLAIASRTFLVIRHTNWLWCYELTVCRMDALAMGSLLAIAARSKNGLASFARPATWGLWITLAMVLAICLHQGTDWDNGSIGQSVGYTILDLACACLMVLTLTSPKTSRRHRFFSHPIMRMFGKYSYALYLFNLPLRAVIRDTVYKPKNFHHIGGWYLPGQLLFYFVSTAFILAVAMLSWHLYEKHFLALKRFFVPRAAKHIAVPQAARQAVLEPVASTPVA